jgi:hypothetical protein
VPGPQGDMKEFRGAAIALGAAIAWAVGVVAVLDAAWYYAVPSSLLVGAGIVALDIALFGKPVGRGTRIGQFAIYGLAAVISLNSLWMAFNLGVSVERARLPAEPYPYIASGPDPTRLLYSAPTQNAVIGLLDQPDVQYVECRVRINGDVWYKLAESRGWVSAEHFMPAPLSGRGESPYCEP